VELPSRCASNPRPYAMVYRLASSTITTTVFFSSSPSGFCGAIETRLKMPQVVEFPLRLDDGAFAQRLARLDSHLARDHAGTRVLVAAQQNLRDQHLGSFVMWYLRRTMAPSFGPAGGNFSTSAANRASENPWS